MTAVATDMPRKPATEAAPRPRWEFVESMDEMTYRLDVARYERMCEMGILGPDDKVYLWKGRLVSKMTKHPPHAVATTRLNTKLVRMVPDEYVVRTDQPVALAVDSMPEPDFAIVRGRAHEAERRHPAANELAMIAEVSDSSLLIDRREKLVEYALANIPIYWIVNIPDNCLEVYTDPTGPGDSPTYATKMTHGIDAEVSLVVDGREVRRIALRDVLPE
jgi:hypothetical protein